MALLAHPGRRSGPKRQSRKTPQLPRNYGFEQSFCEAIKKQVAAAFRYKGDAFERTFGPDAVYLSQKDKVLVEGVVIKNPSDPSDAGKFHRFEVGKVQGVRLTDLKFTPNRIDRFDARYKQIICPLL